MKDEYNRGTGRTTGLILKAIGDALLNQGEWVEFIDHWPHTFERAENFAGLLQGTAGTLGIVVKTKCKERQVFVMSVMPEWGCYK